jgi:RNA polymerase sigma factor (sigma-70 family)
VWSEPHETSRCMTNESLLLGSRKRWNRSLLQILGRRVRASVDIEDLAQETYLRLLRAQSLEEVRNPQAYLLRVAGHVLAEWRDNNPPADELTAVQEAHLTDNCTPEFEIDAQVSQERLNETLASVSPMMRAVLILRLSEERSYKAIAKDLGITERQVKRYLVRGYGRLRDVLEK